MACFAEAMIERHISYDVNVHKNVDKIDTPVIFLSDVRFLEDDEVKSLTDFVNRGGTLIATQMTGTLKKAGGRVEDFALASLLGVHYAGISPYNNSYVRRANADVSEFIEYDEGYPVAVNGSATLVNKDEDVEVLGYLTLPISSSCDTELFSSAISDPPIKDTDYPAITRRKIGKGTAIYIAVPLEESKHYEGRRLLAELITSGIDRRICVDAPEWLEVTVYLDEEKNRYIVNCMNTMSGGYDADAHGVRINVKTDKRISKAWNVTDGVAVEFKNGEGEVSFTLPCVRGYAMTELKY
jgi:hypothetical protein